MPRYEKAGVEVGQIVERMRDKYHPQLRDAGVTMTHLFAFPLTDENGDSKGPALKHHGYPASAIVKIIGLKERTDGRADAEIVIDGENWPTLSDSEKDALIDHELEHLELKYDKEGLLVRDDLDRPKLIIRKHDFEAGWFDSIVRRHGRAAPEVVQWEKFKTVHYEQRWLPYLDAPDTTPVEATPIREANPVSDGPTPHDELKGEVDKSFKKMGIAAGTGPRKRSMAGKTIKAKKPKPATTARGGRRRMAVSSR